MDVSIFLSPVIQYGFAGFAAVLLAIVVWLISMLIKSNGRVLEAMQSNTVVIAKNNEIINKQAATLDKVETAVWTLHNKIISRPCIAKDE